ncbi:hypothetical protein JAAARDRAFT_155337 [Jaapia argillacea MUCL 33604]|uniref:UvrD-like helicase ATP-binding domain-containing protein n=1 Tax=Jaapia argillacea MUCL 33604 TaxID=933084 RepID=A0A067PVH2_9AGAM|nr:hypothetical protein JAAARDRAFT_155337 [Jaapia argillacea MUCL 33604]
MAERGGTVWLSTPPRSFQLGVNYRLHGGIVRCAHSVIGLIRQFWPYAIDILAEEKGIIDGPKPVFFTGWDTDTVSYEQFLFGNSRTRIEFGAQQCILVRDDSAREKLRKEVGDVGLIMTLYESKGLEFDDVLLFNFFEDSTVDASQWRVILNTMEEGERCKIPTPRFDATRHAGVCSELKILYTAITCARKNMWIVDRSVRAEPMRLLWKSKSLVQICAPGAAVPQLAVSSTPEEWEKSGRNLFEHKQYIQAIHCFKRAGLEREVLVANAYHLRQLACSHPLKTPTRSQAFLATAEAFIDCARTAHYDRENLKHIYLKNVAESYVHAGDDPKAAKAFQDACEFTLAAQHYSKASLFDEAVEVIRAHRGEMSEPVASQIVHLARLFYVKENRLGNAIKLFSSPEEGLEFIEHYDLDNARAALLEKMGRVAEAAEVHLTEGRPLEAIRLFLSDRESAHSISRGKQCLLAALRQQTSFGGASSTSDGAKNVVPRLLNLVNDVFLEDTERDEILMFSAFNSRDWAKMLQLGKKFGNHNPAAALFCLDFFFTTLPKIQVSSRQEVGATLQTFLLYAQLLANTARHKDPCGTSSIRKLFNFDMSDQMVVVKPGTFLHDSLLHYGTTFRDDDCGSLVTIPDFLVLFKRALAHRLSTRVQSENELCRKARALQPCLQEAVLGSCSTTECDKDHLPGTSFTPDSYNELVRLHLLQISIFHTVHFVQLPNHIREEQFAFWLGRLYQVVHPPHYLLGHPSDLNWHSIPEADTGRKIVTTWLRHLLYALDPGSATTSNFLPVASQAASLMFLVAPNTAHEIITRAPFVNVPCPPRQLIRPVTNEYIIHDLLGFLNDHAHESISAGVLFLRHVLSNELPIHVDVLCDYMDHLCAAIVIYRKYERSLTLHGITLPRGWLVTILARFDKLVSRDTSLMWVFETLMEEILGHLFARDHLYFDGRRLADCGGRIRNIFIDRIFRSMCLLGYNVGDPRLRNQILKGINSLRIHDRPLSMMCYRYVNATRWEDLARCVRIPSRDSKPEELIQLYDFSKRREEPPKELIGVRLVGFKTIEELKVPKFHESVVETSNLQAEPTAFVPRRISPLSMDLNTVAECPGVPVDIPQEDGSDVLDQADPDEVEQTMDNQDMEYHTNSEGDTRDTYSEQHVQAARTLQVIFRRTRSKHRKAPRLGLPSARAQIFSAYLDASQHMIWPENYYRLLFLGPLPHIVLCLEQSQAHIQTSKQKAKKRLKSAEHQELDEVSEQLTKLNMLLQVVNRLSKALEPKSDLHIRRNPAELVAHVLEVRTLVEQLPNDKKQALRDDLALGLKGIVQEVGSPKEDQARVRR